MLKHLDFPADRKRNKYQFIKIFIKDLALYRFRYKCFVLYSAVNVVHITGVQSMIPCMDDNY